MTGLNRRAALSGGLAAGALVSVGGAQSRPVVNLQLSWLVNGQQLGEICAKRQGFYEAEGLAACRSPRPDRTSTASPCRLEADAVGQISSGHVAGDRGLAGHAVLHRGRAQEFSILLLLARAQSPCRRRT